MNSQIIDALETVNISFTEKVKLSWIRVFNQEAIFLQKE